MHIPTPKLFPLLEGPLQWLSMLPQGFVTPQLWDPNTFLLHLHSITQQTEAFH